MSFLNWFRLGRAPIPSRLREVLTRVLAFLRVQPAGQEIIPAILAKAIHETEPVALTALRILTEQGITKEHFGLYCADRDIPLSSAERIEDLPKNVPCADCDTDHNRLRGEAKMSLYYTVNDDVLKRKAMELAIG